MTWWKVAVPLLAILVLAFANFDTGNLHAANGFSPDGLKGILAAVSTGGIIFSYLGFEQADQLAGEAQQPASATSRSRSSARSLLGTVIYIALQVAFLFALPASAIGKTWADAARGLLHRVHRSVRRGGDPAQPRLAGLRSSTPTRSSARPAPA